MALSGLLAPLALYLRGHVTCRRVLYSKTRYTHTQLLRRRALQRKSTPPDIAAALPAVATLHELCMHVPITSPTSESLHF